MGTSPDAAGYLTHPIWYGMSAEDAKMQAMVAEDAKTKVGQDAAPDAKTRVSSQLSRSEMAANEQLFSNGMAPPTNAEFVNPNVFQWVFNTSADVLEYVQCQQDRGIPVVITPPESLNR